MVPIAYAELVLNLKLLQEALDLESETGIRGLT